ncbi:MAG: hypothetical protein FD123_1838 [Bacteroidetes bacterium]|nr:MAG: hypothetical protein FD123_1838 [Bacteroidota bacterium]
MASRQLTKGIHALDYTTLPAGIYLVQVQSENGNAAQRLVITK